MENADQERSSGIEYTLEEIANTEPDVSETSDATVNSPRDIPGLPDFLKPGYNADEMPHEMPHEMPDATVKSQSDIPGLPDFLKPGYTRPETPAVPIGSNTPQFNGHPKDYLEFLMKTK